MRRIENAVTSRRKKRILNYQAKSNRVNSFRLDWAVANQIDLSEPFRLGLQPLHVVSIYPVYLSRLNLSDAEPAMANSPLLVASSNNPTSTSDRGNITYLTTLPRINMFLTDDRCGYLSRSRTSTSSSLILRY